MAFRGESSTMTQRDTEPLLRPIGKNNVAILCTSAVLSSLALVWCILDQWNHIVSDALFTLGDLRFATIDGNSAQQGLMVFNTSKMFPSFTYPLTLAFLQFLCMGLLFLLVYSAMLQDSSLSWRQLVVDASSSWRWLPLVITHVFSIFWLQSLIMPAHALSIGVFAASRAIEIPAAAFLRVPLAGANFTIRSRTTMFTFAAAIIVYYAYAQVSGCLCVWSGHGVSLVGSSFWIVYLLVLILPATNTVLQEGMVKQQRMHPVLMLGLQNISAAVFIIPALLLAHISGWENVGAALAVITGHREVYMLVTWLCVQMTFISGVTAGVTYMTNSFWAVSLRALRVVYWWIQQIAFFYIGAVVAGQSTSISLVSPVYSMWSFVILCGCMVAAGAVYMDYQADDPRLITKKLNCRSSFSGDYPNKSALSATP